STLEFTINYHVTDNILIELYSINGAFIKQLTRDSINQQGAKTYSFLVEDLAAGNYVLDFHSNTGRTSKKFVKL
ncbi:T9SS type A sorting domain-containing protein, partial [Algibacter sp.]|uniref:T9SS type A sorting domain-containing protein n=1 Tax=Algibacter sp. TaxID=1872428 RepID=UPI003C78D1B4